MANRTIAQRIKNIHEDAFTAAYISLVEGDIPAMGSATNNALNVETFRKKSILVSTSTACNVYFQGSMDGTTWFTLHGVDGGTAGFDEEVVLAVDTKNVWFQLDAIIRFFRIFIDNTEAEICHVKAGLVVM